MEIKVHARNLNLTPRLEEYIDKKVERLDRYLSNITEANLELRKEGRTEQPIAQLTIRNKRGMIFRVEDKKQQDIFAAVDMVIDKMYRQLQRYKTKVQSKKGSDRWTDIELEDLGLAIDRSPDDVQDDSSDDVAEEKQVVRRKNVLLSPMHEEEAVEQLELLGHDFFLFLNGDTGTINVLYKRQDGNYGLLVAEAD